MKASRSFSKRLSLYTIIATAVLFIVALFIVGLASFKSIYNSAVKEASSLLDYTLLDIENTLTEVESSSNSSQWLLEKFHDNQDALVDVAVNLVKADTNIISCAIGFEPFEFNEDDVYFCPQAITLPDGSITTQMMGSADYEYHLMDWYLIPKLLGHEYWSEPSFDTDGSGRLITSYSRPLFHEDGTFFGVMKSDIDLNWLTERIQSMRPYKNSYTILVGRNGAFISHMDSTKILNETIFTDALMTGNRKFIELGKNMMAGKKGLEQCKLKGFNGFLVYGPLKNGWSGALVCDYKDIFSKATRMNNISFFVALLALVLLYFSNKKIIARLSQPITEFAYSALNIAQGNFKASIPEVHTQDELRRLYDSLNYMEMSIDKYIGELRTTTASNERYESELNIASAIQMQMLPKDFPNREEIDLYAMLHPAKEVGGDLYDFFVNERKLYFCVGDVSGKGVPAALYMAITRSAFRFIAGLGLPVDGVVTKINNAFCDGNDSGMFVTMFVACINLDTLEMKYCNAGHNPILVVSPEGKPEYLHAKPNLAAGLFEDFPYQGETLQLQRGSRLVIYTDGVTEAENRVKNLYGEDRLEEFAKKEDKGESSEEFLSHLGTSIKEFTLDNPQNDDITMMSIRIK